MRVDWTRDNSTPRLLMFQSFQFEVSGKFDLTNWFFESSPGFLFEAVREYGFNLACNLLNSLSVSDAPPGRGWLQIDLTPIFIEIRCITEKFTIGKPDSFRVFNHPKWNTFLKLKRFNASTVEKSAWRQIHTLLSARLNLLHVRTQHIRVTYSSPRSPSIF